MVLPARAAWMCVGSTYSKSWNGKPRVGREHGRGEGRAGLGAGRRAPQPPGRRPPRAVDHACPARGQPALAFPALGQFPFFLLGQKAPEVILGLLTVTV